MNMRYRLVLLLQFSMIAVLSPENILGDKKEIILKDNFGSDKIWTFLKGNWKSERNRLVQNNVREWNTNSYTALKQSGFIVYEWKVIMRRGILDAGLHIFVSHGFLSERGNSYLIWQFKEGFVIYKSINNRLLEMIRFSSQTVKDKIYSCLIKYDSNRGKMTIYRNGKLIGSWKDNNPLKQGQYISFRTNKTHAEFSDLRIYRYREDNPDKDGGT